MRQTKRKALMADGFPLFLLVHSVDLHPHGKVSGCGVGNRGDFPRRVQSRQVDGKATDLMGNTRSADRGGVALFRKSCANETLTGG